MYGLREQICSLPDICEQNINGGFSRNFAEKLSNNVEKNCSEPPCMLPEFLISADQHHN